MFRAGGFPLLAVDPHLGLDRGVRRGEQRGQSTDRPAVDTGGGNRSAVQTLDLAGEDRAGSSVPDVALTGVTVAMENAAPFVDG